jgi:hypothetical protein
MTLDEAALAIKERHRPVVPSWTGSPRPEQSAPTCHLDHETWPCVAIRLAERLRASNPIPDSSVEEGAE